MVAIQKLKVGLVAFLFLSLTGTPMVWFSQFDWNPDGLGRRRRSRFTLEEVDP
jgi:hypothetical protein